VFVVYPLVVNALPPPFTDIPIGSDATSPLAANTAAPEPADSFRHTNAWLAVALVLRNQQAMVNGYAVTGAADIPRNWLEPLKS
jgi:hypothetical protein